MNKVKNPIPRPRPVPDPSWSQAYLERVAESEMAWLKPLTDFQIAMIEAWADLASEWTSFLASRVRQDVDTQHAILHCRTPAELLQIQSDFYQRAIDSYRAEAGRMTVLMEEATRAMVPRGNSSK